MHSTDEGFPSQPLISWLSMTCDANLLYRAVVAASGEIKPCSRKFCFAVDALGRIMMASLKRYAAIVGLSTPVRYALEEKCRKWKVAVNNSMSKQLFGGCEAFERNFMGGRLGFVHSKESSRVDPSDRVRLWVDNRASLAAMVNVRRRGTTLNWWTLCFGRIFSGQTAIRVPRRSRLLCSVDAS
ncbi:hypothetical protein EJ02DRAFT_144786 [Clathrospora elynae]|uniref:Uncharacterized protein n=1 Tax=Clathrospora elynae TaxID=706981 RepID=A0A6A5STP4_9PLEO|nr:hypothetical protein EJ02DRAFT_144786 [Clathrospora elynae]